MESLLKRNQNILKSHKIKELAHYWNLDHCVPPLSQEEEEKQWKDALKFIQTKNQEKENSEDNENEFDLVTTASEVIMKGHSFLTVEETKEMWHYKNGVYVLGAEILIEKEAEKTFGYDLANKHLAEIKGHIMRRTYHKREELDADINIINLKNGLYSIEKDVLIEHRLP